MKYQFTVDHIDPETAHGKILSQIAPNSVILECGSATGYITKFLNEELHCKVHIIEYEQEAFDLAKQYAEGGVCGDLNDSNWVSAFSGMQFDYILFMDVLEHLYSPNQVLQQAVPLLKEDGSVLISLPNIAHNDIIINLSNNEFNYQERGLLDSTHIRFFGKNNLNQLLENTGLCLTKYDCTYVKTGTSEQFWTRPCCAPDALLKALSQREGGEEYQFILTAQKQSYCQEHGLGLTIAASEHNGAALSDYAALRETCSALEAKLAESEANLTESEAKLAATEALCRNLTEEQTLVMNEVSAMLKSNWPNQEELPDLTSAVQKLHQNHEAMREEFKKEQQKTEDAIFAMLKTYWPDQEEMPNLNSAMRKLRTNIATEQRLHLQCNETLNAANAAIEGLEDRCRFAEENYRLVTNSRGHRMLTKYYTLRNKLLPQGTLRYKFVRAVARPVLHLLRSNAQGNGAGIAEDNGNKPIFAPHTLTKDEAYLRIKSCTRIDILAVPHTAYVAKTLQGILQSAGIASDIHLTEPEQYENIPYIIICPQNFKHFPELYMAFQMEQTISDRWLTDEYLEILRNAYVVFDYSLVNIDYFSKDPIISTKLFYLPIDLCDAMVEAHRDSWTDDKEYDVLFYGAPFAEHRQAFLKPLSERFNTRIVSEMFGDELYEEMKKAKIVINIHYYEDALLETTRLFEILSVCNTMIVSERSNDPTEEKRFDDLIDFVEIGDVDGMIERIAYWLDHEEERRKKVAENRRILDERTNAASFFLHRFLLANDRISFDYFYNAVGDYVHFNNNRVCLSLPEATERRASFDKDNHYGFEVFSGLKHYHGWIGCGMSYKFIFRKALEQGFDQILICEDDIYFPDDFEERFRKVLEYTSTHDDWNVFSGLMSDLGDVSVLDCTTENGENFVYLSRMISMVFNLYDKSIFETIANWDNKLVDIETNTIDRYLENMYLRILTTDPFLVGHKEDLFSTLWGAQNTTYNDLIAQSSAKLTALVKEYSSAKDTSCQIH